MHPNNKHSAAYDFDQLIGAYEPLKPYVHEAYGTSTIAFSDPSAVKALNAALLRLHYGIEHWSIPESYLCPPIPSRVDYIHHLSDLLTGSQIKAPIAILDIGTGASCIYPILGNAVFGWQFIASEINTVSLKSAQQNIDNNKLSERITLRFQKNPDNIVEGILEPDEKISATMCNPPFYKDEREAKAATERKLKGLGLDKLKEVRNFGGKESELWYQGGEKAFLHNYLYQSQALKDRCHWFTSLVSKGEHVKSMQASHKKLGGTNFKMIPTHIGNKKSRIIAWNFL